MIIILNVIIIFLRTLTTNVNNLQQFQTQYKQNILIFKS